MTVDIKFIASKAGVSIATVSRVLNDSKRVSDTLRERVLAEVERYNYYPNTLARSMILKQTNLVGIVAPNISDLYHARALLGIQRCAERYDYNVIVSNVFGDYQKQIKSFQLFRERRVDGILVLHENTYEEMEALLDKVDVPLVLTNVNIPGSTLPSVGIDETGAAFDAVSYLARIGHKRIAAILGDSYSLNTLRYEGYRSALEKAGLPWSKQLVKSTECSIRGGAKTVEELMGLQEPPTAVFCAADEIAIGAMDHLLQLGYRVPEDISVFGFDNINMASIIRPRLSTVNQPVEEIGERAMKLLVTLMRENRRDAGSVVLKHNLVLRDSCQKIVS